MSTPKKTPKMEGGVSRAVDFNLKKEDLMLLILEGRKEVMEEEISAIQTKSVELQKDLEKAQEVLRKDIHSRVFKTLNAEAKKLIESFSIKDLKKKEDEDDDELTENSLKIILVTENVRIPYTRFVSEGIGANKTGTHIKNQRTDYVDFQTYRSAKISVALSLHGRTFVNKNDIFSNKEFTRACSEYSRDFIIAEESLDKEFITKTATYQKVEVIAKKLAENNSLYSDIIAEYDLFNRNQPRAKARMIKEVLGRDESGQALLENIVAAASGVKLLAGPGDGK